MNLAFFDDRFFEVYGAQENLLMLAEAARRAGAMVTVITTAEGEFAAGARDRGLEVSIVEAPLSLRTFEKGLIHGGWRLRARAAVQSLLYSRKLHAHLRTIGVDLVTVSSIRSALLLARTRVSRRVRTLFFVQNSTPFGIYAALAAIGADRVALISKGSESTFPAWSRFLYRRRLVLLPSGRDLARYAVADERCDRSPGSRLRVITVCAISERKGLHVLVEALAIARRRGMDCDLTVVGGTGGAESVAYLERVTAAAARDGVPFTFHGHQVDIVPYLAAADIFALASSSEGLPGVLIEAMAAGMPVVTTDAGGCREIVAEGQTGRVVPIGDAAAFAEALLTLSPPDVRRTMSEHGREVVQRDFSDVAFYRRFATIASAMLHPDDVPSVED